MSDDMERRSTDKRRGTDTLRTNPEVMERNDPDQARSNPEVMGRSEPQTMTAPRHDERWSGMNDVQLRFEQLQSEFIDDPKSAVKKTEQLMEDMLNKLRERMQNIHRDIEKGDDTERLRLAMRSYRDMIDSFGGRRPA